jgi:succinate dehydrogenase/fumarate reductase flavoprotein subunit
MEKIDADLLVLGAGMAGHTVAGYAAQRGARVMLVEKAPEPGGSAVMSGTSLWTVATEEVLRERVPHGDLELGRHLISTYRDAVDWVRSTGTQLTAPRWVLGYGRGYRFDILGYFERCRALVRAAGGWVLTSTRTQRLIQRDGRIVGAVLRAPDGDAVVETPATVIATGGFQADRERLRAVFGENGDRLLIRSNPHSTGDGLSLATSVGGATAGDMRTFYGHMMMSPIPGFSREHYTLLGMWFSEVGVVLNARGERFVDESLGDHQAAQALAREPEARGLLVLDEFLVQNMQMNDVKISQKLDEGRRAGVRIASVASLDELAGVVNAWGFDGAAAVASIREYNDQLYGRGGPPRVPRKAHRHPLIDPPFHVLETQVGITFTQGGIKIDTSARVLDAAGVPIPGLLAAGADVGGVYEGGYAGGLALACVFGLTAARTVLSEREMART